MLREEREPHVSTTPPGRSEAAIYVIGPPWKQSLMKPKALLSWSSGKDCAWALHVLRQRGDVEAVGLVTTFNEAVGRVAMHGIRIEVVRLFRGSRPRSPR